LTLHVAVIRRSLCVVDLETTRRFGDTSFRQTMNDPSINKISTYFSPVSASSPAKRAHSSSDSDISFNKEKPEAKRLNMATHSESSSESSLDSIQVAFQQILERMNTLATKEEIFQMKTQVKDLTDGVMKRLDEMDGQILDVEHRTTKTEKDVKVLQGKTTRHQSNLSELEKRINALEKEQNELQQYSRRWNLRVYKVPEAKGETADDCRTKVCRIFTDLVGVATNATDVEVAHRSGKPAPIL